MRPMQTTCTETESLGSYAVFFWTAVEGSTINVELDVEKNLLTLKHDRECNLEVKIEPDSVTVDEYTIEIKRTNESVWYPLATSKTLTPWYGNVAGTFDLRGMAKINGVEIYSQTVVVTNQFPSYAQIVGDTNVQAFTDTEWANTLADCTENPNQRRERGFWIRLNTTSDSYEHTTVIEGPWIAPTNTAYLTVTPRPADSPATPAPNAAGATYSVAFFHTHTPTTYRPGQGVRGVGPSGPDNTFHTAQQVPGVVYDYIESPAGSGTIPMGHPKNAPAQRYHSMGFDRRPTP